LDGWSLRHARRRRGGYTLIHEGGDRPRGIHDADDTPVVIERDGDLSLTGADHRQAIDDLGVLHDGFGDPRSFERTAPMGRPAAFPLMEHAVKLQAAIQAKLTDERAGSGDALLDRGRVPVRTIGFAEGSIVG